VSPVAVDVHLEPDHALTMLRSDALNGLTKTPKELPPKWFYDERGSQLFDEITRLHEYYPTRREREILTRRAGEIAALTHASTLVELGSGTSDKTRLLLDALYATGRLHTFVPVDVSAEILVASADTITREYPGLAVHAVVGDFERHLGVLPRGEGPRLVAFLGGTIGNLYPHERALFFREIASILSPEDAFLLGTDLVKDTGRLNDAYNDARGVTAEFNRNVLRVLNRELGADFDIAAFDHVARYDEANAWIEMALRSRIDQVVNVDDLDLTVRFAAGEEMRTEISAKFTRLGVEEELAHAGLVIDRWWTDDSGDFALSLSTLRP